MPDIYRLSTIEREGVIAVTGGRSSNQEGKPPFYAKENVIGAKFVMFVITGRTDDLRGSR